MVTVSSSRAQTLASTALLGLLLAAQPGCASRYTVPSSGPTFAADAKIAVSVNKTGVRQVKIKMVHLAPIKRINPNFSAYVVWIAVPGEATTRAGSLKFSDYWRTGKLTATTPHPKFEVIITIEENPSASAPSDKVLVRKIVSKI